MLWKLTVSGMYDYGQFKDDDLFSDMIIPSELDREVVVNQILITCGELPVFYPDYEFFKNQIRVWFKRKKPIFDKMVELMNEEFNPLYNYDRHEEYEDSEINKGSSKSKSSGNNSSDSTNSATSYNSETLKNTDKNISTSKSDASFEGTNDNDRTLKHKAHLYGNIGVTTSVDMLAQAWDWYNTSIPEIIAEEFKCDFCIGLYC